MSQIHALIDENRRIHDAECVNLDPGTNVMNPRAEAAGVRPRLATLARLSGRQLRDGARSVEKIEVIAAELAAEIRRKIRRNPGGLRGDGESLRLHGDRQSGGPGHRAAREHRGAHHAPRRVAAGLSGSTSIRRRPTRTAIRSNREAADKDRAVKPNSSRSVAASTCSRIRSANCGRSRTMSAQALCSTPRICPE